MQNYLNQTNLEEVKLWINHNVTNYLKTNPENVSEIEHIIDFFNATNPPRLKKMSYKQAKQLSEAWLKTQIKKGNSIEEGITDVELVKDFNDGYKLVRLVGEAAFKREGFLMSHCVGSYANKKDTAVYSIRDSRNMPHCTIEVTGKSQVQQIKGKGNGSIHPNYIQYIVKTLEHFNMPVRDSEMQNLGYIKLSDYGKDIVALVKEKIKPIKTVTFKGTEYFYMECLK